MATESAASSRTAARPALGRIVGIDILRGYAIVGIVIFHLWEDIRYHISEPHSYYSYLAGDFRGGGWDSIPTTLLDSALSTHYLVATFMMLSGLSLYMATARKGGIIDNVPRFYFRRLRTLLVPYWFTVAMIFVVICCIAVLQVALHGGGLAFQYHHVTQARYDLIAPGRWELFATIFVFPRALRSEWLYVTPSVLWFVVLHVQYYLLFPSLLVGLRRFGVAQFLVSSLAFTLAMRLALFLIAGDLWGYPARNMAHALAPFRMFEFALGMSLGYLLVHRRERLAAFVAPKCMVAILIAAGVCTVVGCNLVDAQTRLSGVVAEPMVVAGVALVALPLLTKAPGRIEASAPGRLFACVGPLSYAVLIANEPLRLVASFLRVEEVPTSVWWMYLVVYVPLTLILARPVASFLGLGRQATMDVHLAPAAAVAPTAAL